MSTRIFRCDDLEEKNISEWREWKKNYNIWTILEQAKKNRWFRSASYFN